MRDAAPQTIHLKDYQPFGYELEEVHLTFKLDPSATVVISRIRFVPVEGRDPMFFLHGEGLKLRSARIDGAEVSPEITEQGLTCAVPDGPFTWEAEVEIDPAGNTALEGLYLSNGMYCTQCEAEGFRKITYYPDRPDVMSVFTVRINGPHETLLSNGNPTAAGEGWAEWHDPWKKPAYLFALVAGDLHATSGTFTTMEGRDVALNIYVRDGDQDKTSFALEALIKSMKWDEEVYQRAYDLSVFNIVAVDDFNMGAMENKGLNVFNSSAVLASAETATDANFERIEAIIAHEYFHNWTGNRITCRDWFQLCLKEGLTVFRDQQFTADMRSAPVARIENVIGLRAAQFREDAGPLAHPVRPESFVEINNFYTATVYEKGAELIGMLHTLVGAAAYDAALQLYFERHDGDAATIEDWLRVFEDSTGRDLSQFKRWYAQAGTPRLTVTETYDGERYSLHVSQATPPTPGQEHKEPVVIPIQIGLLHPDGSEACATTLFEFTTSQDTLTFVRDGAQWSPLHLSSNTSAGGDPTATAKPIPSILRGFSAPVILDQPLKSSDRAVLLAHDTDPFNRWEAGRALGKEALTALIQHGTPPSEAYLDGVKALLTDDRLDPAFRALALGLPSEDDMAQTFFEQGQTPDPDRIRDALETLAHARATHVQDALPGLYAQMQVEGPYSPDAGPVGKRDLGNAVLSMLTRLDGGAQATTQFANATNMTQSLAALGCLARARKAQTPLALFYDKWRHERLVIDKWFGLQAIHAPREKAAQIVADLTKHADFTMKNPNRFRALFGSFVGNAAAFHRADGSGYALLADWLIKLDALNPQTTARMTSAFSTWRRYDPDRQAALRDALSRIKATPGLSRDTTEMVTRLLG